MELMPLIGVQRGRRVALLLNPIGGKGKARQLVKTIALPILEAAGLKVEVYGMYCLLLKDFRLSPTYGKRYIAETQHAKHGEMIAQDLPLDFE
jgi:sphingosine kinase